MLRFSYKMGKIFWMIYWYFLYAPNCSFIHENVSTSNIMKKKNNLSFSRLEFKCPHYTNHISLFSKKVEKKREPFLTCVLFQMLLRHFLWVHISVSCLYPCQKKWPHFLDFLNLWDGLSVDIIIIKIYRVLIMIKSR